MYSLTIEVKGHGQQTHGRIRETTVRNLVARTLGLNGLHGNRKVFSDELLNGAKSSDSKRVTVGPVSFTVWER